MAEGLLGGVLGGGDEKPETEAPEALAGTEAFAAAIAAIASRQDPEVARNTSVFLKRQAQLLEIQAEHLKDEHALRLSHLAHQSHLLWGQRLGQGIRIAFQVVIALVVIVIGIGIVVMLRDAFTSHSVVIDAFDAPADLAARGVTGKVVAGDVLDELTRLQNATSGTAATFKRSLSNAWSNQVTVEVPETGVSLGELSRLLRERFGHDLHIGGALIETDTGGLALTVRGDNIAPTTFTGSAGMLQPLAAQAAQYLYAQSEPALWAYYLLGANRCAEDITFIRSAFGGAAPQYRPYLLNAESGCLWETGAPMREVTTLEHRAQALKPDYWATYDNEQRELVALGDEEGAWRAAQQLRQAAAATPRTYLRPWDELTGDFLAARDALVADDLQGNESTKFIGQTGGLRALLAIYEVELHDPDAAELTLQNVPQDTPEQVRRVSFTRARVAQERGDPITAEKEMETAWPATAIPFGRGAGMVGGPKGCWIAPIEEAAGHPDRADAILAEGTHFVDCQRFRGDLLDQRGDWAGAQQAYAAAVALAPDLPFGDYSWGVALARHGDLAGALAKLQAAHQRSPHWADPLKAWGDVLAKQGHRSDALAKYDEALQYAPDWAALKQARGAAASK